MCFTSESQRNKNGREDKEKETKEYTVQNIQIQVKHKRNPKLTHANYQDLKIMVRFYFRIWLHLVELQVIAFWGGPYRFTWFGAFFNTIGPSLTKVVYAYFDGSSSEIQIFELPVMLEVAPAPVSNMTKL